MTAKVEVQRVLRHAICVRAPGRPPLFWIHAENRPYCGEGKTAEAAWRDAHRRLPPSYTRTQSEGKNG